VFPHESTPHHVALVLRHDQIAEHRGSSGVPRGSQLERHAGVVRLQASHDRRTGRQACTCDTIRNVVSVRIMRWWLQASSPVVVVSPFTPPIHTFSYGDVLRCPPLPKPHLREHYCSKTRPVTRHSALPGVTTTGSRDSAEGPPIQVTSTSTSTSTPGSRPVMVMSYAHPTCRSPFHQQMSARVSWQTASQSSQRPGTPYKGMDQARSVARRVKEYYTP
jgi:hypothetical protein